MADNANKLLQQNIELVNQSTQAWANYTKVLQSSSTTQAQLNEQLKKVQGAKEFAAVQKQIQGNIKAVALAEKEAIEIQKKSEQLTRERIKTTSAQSKEKARLARETGKLNSLYKQESARLTEIRNKAKNVALQFGLTSKEFRKAATEVNKLDTKLKSVDSRLGQSQRNVGNYTKGLGGVGRSLLGAAGVVGGVQLFVSALRNGLKISKEYEKSNAVLAGVLGKTRKETVLLQKESKRLGASTAFSASQVTELQIELARLGKSEADIIGTTESIIDATIALGSETGETAALIGSTLNAFNLTAKDSAAVVDTLVLSTQKSALSFEKLNTALPTVSGAAKAAGVSLETMVAQLGQAADRGLDASTSATSLRNIYITLAEKGMTLETALRNINESQDKLSTATQLFGKRAAVTALALADNTGKTKELADALRDAGGTAERVANEQLNTLDGQLKLLNSAWEGFVLSIGDSESAIGGLTKALVKFSTAVLTSFTATDFAINEGVRILDELKKKYEELPSVISGVFTMQEFLVNELVLLGETQEEANGIVSQYLDILAQQIKDEEAAAIAVQEQTKAITNQTQIIKESTAPIQSRGQIAVDTEDTIQAALVETTKVYQDAEDARTRIAEEAAAQRAELEMAVTDAAFESLGIASDAFFSASQEKRDLETQAQIDALNQRLENDKLDEEQRLLIQADIDKKEAALKNKKAKADRKAALIESVINTALSIGKTAATIPFPAAIPFIAFAAIVGAAQQIAIASQPIPKFDKGTDNFPGLGLVGEKRSEFVENNGHVELFQKPTLLGSDYKGAKVVGGAESAKILDQISRQELISSVALHDDNVQNKLIAAAIDRSMRKSSDRIVDAIKQNKPVIKMPDSRTNDLRDSLRN